MTEPQEITKAQLSEYDHLVGIDFSGSMSTPSKRVSGTRLDEVKEHVTGLVGWLKDVDEDGLTLVPFSTSATVVDGVKDGAAVVKLFSERGPKGTTALHLMLDAAQRKREQSGKPLFVHIFTDGDPDNKPAVEACLKRMTNAMTRDGDLAINILQVGDDPECEAYLQSLDDAKERLGLKFDAVNTLTAAKSDGLTYGQIMWLALND